MKNLMTICLFFLSIGLMAQTKPKVDIVTKQGAQLKCKVISMDKQKIQIERADGRTGIASSETIESINGMTYEEFYEMYKDGISETVSFPLNDSGEIEYTEVVQAEGVDAKELFVRAKEWIALTFNSANHVIQLDDKEAGKLIGKGRSEIFTSHPYSENRIVSYGHIDYTIEIQTKEGRYKYVISGISHEFNAYVNPLSGAVMQTPGNILAQPEPTTGLKVNKKTWQLVRYATDQKISQIILSLKEKMKESSGRDDDW